MLRPEILAIFIPILALMIPIIALFMSHQQKMATILRDGQTNANASELAEMRREMSELKQLVHQQMIAMDNLVSRETRVAPSVQAPPPAPVESVQQRLGGA